MCRRAAKAVSPVPRPHHLPTAGPAGMGVDFNRYDNQLGGKGMKRYCWLDMKTGEFSSSWTEDDMRGETIEEITAATSSNWKLIKYECLNDSDFEFYDLMQITTKKRQP